MLRKIRVVIAVASVLYATSALAGHRCHIPLADWQPRDALLEKVRAMGWTVTRIKTDDGCYKVYATDAKGESIKAKFNPETLDIIKRGHSD